MTRTEAKMLVWMQANGYNIHYDGGFTDEIVYLRYDTKTNKYTALFYNPSYEDKNDIENIRIDRFIVSKPICTLTLIKIAKKIPNNIKIQNIEKIIIKNSIL